MQLSFFEGTHFMPIYNREPFRWIVSRGHQKFSRETTPKKGSAKKCTSNWNPQQVLVNSMFRDSPTKKAMEQVYVKPALTAGS